MMSALPLITLAHREVDSDAMMGHTMMETNSMMMEGCGNLSPWFSILGIWFPILGIVSYLVWLAVGVLLLVFFWQKIKQSQQSSETKK